MSLLPQAGKKTRTGSKSASELSAPWLKDEKRSLVRCLRLYGEIPSSFRSEILNSELLYELKDRHTGYSGSGRREELNCDMLLLTDSFLFDGEELRKVFLRKGDSYVLSGIAPVTRLHLQRLALDDFVRDHREGNCPEEILRLKILEYAEGLKDFKEKGLGELRKILDSQFSGNVRTPSSYPFRNLPHFLPGEIKSDWIGSLLDLYKEFFQGWFAFWTGGDNDSGTPRKLTDLQWEICSELYASQKYRPVFGEILLSRIKEHLRALTEKEILKLQSRMNNDLENYFRKGKTTSATAFFESVQKDYDDVDVYLNKLSVTIREALLLLREQSRGLLPVPEAYRILLRAHVRHILESFRKTAGSNDPVSQPFSGLVESGAFNQDYWHRYPFLNFYYNALICKLFEPEGPFLSAMHGYLHELDVRDVDLKELEKFYRELEVKFSLLPKRTKYLADWRSVTQFSNLRNSIQPAYHVPAVTGSPVPSRGTMIIRCRTAGGNLLFSCRDRPDASSYLNFRADEFYFYFRGKESRSTVRIFYPLFSLDVVTSVQAVAGYLLGSVSR